MAREQPFWSSPPMNQQLRRKIRQIRRALTDAQQERAGSALFDTVSKLGSYRNARRIAFYLPNDGEIDTSFLLEHTARSGKACYIPVIHPTKQHRLHFVRYAPGTALLKNRFGIPEPPLASKRIAPIWTLDIIFVPLVAFDRSGARLGMGGGYYDRTLAHFKSGRIKKPLLIGVAHSCQEVDPLQRSPWDVALHMIATDKELIIATPTD